MVLWALSRLEDLAPAWRFLDCTEIGTCKVGSLALSGLLSECQERGLRGEEQRLLHLLACFSPNLRMPAADVAALQLAEVGRETEVLEFLRQQPRLSAVSEKVWRACRGGPLPPQGAMSQRFTLAPHSAHYKEARLLAYVLSVAPPSNLAAACEAIERFGRDNLSRAYGGGGGWAPSAGSWLKVAGGDKAAILASAARLMPGVCASPGRILEVGTYCGYSALRLAAARPGAKILSLEADPGAAVIARCILAHAGLSHIVEVRIGHSEDVLPKLAARAGVASAAEGTFGLVFFDQRGSRYNADLATLERAGALAPGAVILADNVLKPGAPAFLWRLLHGGDYATQVVPVHEYAMPGVEDWMSLSVRLPEGALETDEEVNGGPTTCSPPPLPPRLRRLEWEADQIRSRAESSPGVGFEAWAEFVEEMREGLAQEGIGPTGPGTISR
mmetsp:Transcript_56433/g.127548  ORF Transcript_56433/g.127548 Transcript_56433/m.127548 type:complete len:444 (+) Transcript_56433:143-1474(+)